MTTDDYQPRLCVECAHYEESEGAGVLPVDRHRCHHPRCIDRVTGESVPCAQMRRRRGACGPEGACWSPLEVVCQVLDGATDAA